MEDKLKKQWTALLQNKNINLHYIVLPFVSIFVSKRTKLMDKKTIIENIKSRLGIEQLNEMQQALISSDAPNIILTSPTGSGKTLAFACRMFKSLRTACGEVQAIVIAPSRELVMQIESVIRPIATGYKTMALYGGHSMADERNSLTPTPDIVIATPGRLLDHMQRKQLQAEKLRVLVLDEYDKSLQLGFEQEMKRIVGRIGFIGNTILTSATKLDVIPEYLPLSKATHMDFTMEETPRERTQIAEVHSFTRDKLDTLTALLQTFSANERSIVFVNHRESAERVYKHLHNAKLASTLYHGALDQQQRAMAIDLFANGTANILVATDLAARGLDVDFQAWTHRNGRTARMNANGMVWAITSEADNIPEYITFDREFQPNPIAQSTDTNQNRVATLYISAGKKEKISKGDVAGFIAASAVTESTEIGKIMIHDHHAVVAIPAIKACETAKALNSIKLKGKKVRVSIVRI